jgi:hypothetical protein
MSLLKLGKGSGVKYKTLDSAHYEKPTLFAREDETAHTGMSSFFS